MGIEILSFTIKDVFDDVQYLASLGNSNIFLYLFFLTQQKLQFDFLIYKTFGSRKSPNRSREA